MSPCMTPSSCLPQKELSAVLARCMVRAFLWSDCDVPRMRPSCAGVWWRVSSTCLMQGQGLMWAKAMSHVGQGSGSWRDLRDVLQALWAGILHLQSKLSVLSPKSLSLCCYHIYNNKQRKQAISRSIRGSEISKLI